MLQDLDDALHTTRKDQKKLQQQHKKLQEEFEEKSQNLENKQEVG